MIDGQMHFPAAQDRLYSRIFAGVAWPALRAGFVVIVGEHRHERSGGVPVLHVLDEATDDRLWHVVQKAAALWFYYKPESFLADTEHVAAMQFVHEFAGKGFAVQTSLLPLMDGPMGYALPMLDRLLKNGRLVIPDNSLLKGEMMTPPANEELGKLRLADFPGIAALAFAVLELDRTREDDHTPRQTEAAKGGKVLP